MKALKAAIGMFDVMVSIVLLHTLFSCFFIKCAERREALRFVLAFCSIVASHYSAHDSHSPRSMKTR